MSSLRTAKTGLIFFPAFDWAISPTHPEREERLLYTRDQIFEEGLMDLPEIEEYKPRLAEMMDIARTHFCVPDVESQVTEAHLIAAGSTLTLANANELLDHWIVAVTIDIARDWTWEGFGAPALTVIPALAVEIVVPLVYLMVTVGETSLAL